jgi:hypothetical protein
VVSTFPFALGECELNTAGAAAKADDDGVDGCELGETMIAEIVIGPVAFAPGIASASDEPVGEKASGCGSKVNSGSRWDEVDVGVGACTVCVAFAGA